MNRSVRWLVAGVLGSLFALSTPAHALAPQADGFYLTGEVTRVKTVGEELRTTTVSISGGPSTAVAGEDFMRALWCSWFDRGPEDQRDLGDALVAYLP